MDGREAALVGTFTAKAEERAHHLQGSLGHGFFEVTACRGNGTANRHGTGRAVLQANHATAFIEGGNHGFEVGREGFFTGDFFQAAAHFT